MINSNKEIAIITSMNKTDFDFNVQSVALYKLINELGYNTKIINYSSGNSARYVLKLKDVFRRAKNTWNIEKFEKILPKENIEKFNDFFKNNTQLTDTKNSYYELFELNKEIDAFIVGGHQIWSPIKFNKNNFLSFVKNKEKIISYAPSFGVDNIQNKQIKKEMSKLITDFTYLSIREKQGQKIIKNLTDKSSNIVLDPVLMLSKDNWDEITNKSNSNIIIKR